MMFPRPIASTEPKFIADILKQGRTNPRGVPASFDDQQNEATVNNNTPNQLILSFRAPPGLKGYITAFGQAWDAVMDTFVDYSLKVNGGVVFPYNQLKAQICAPEQAALVPLPKPIVIEQLSLIEVYADVPNITGFTSGNFTARVICKYFSPQEIFSL